MWLGQMQLDLARILALYQNVDLLPLSVFQCFFPTLPSLSCPALAHLMFWWFLWSWLVSCAHLTAFQTWCSRSGRDILSCAAKLLLLLVLVRMIFSALLQEEPLSNLAIFAFISWRGRMSIPTLWFDRQAHKKNKRKLIVNFKQNVLSHPVDSVVLFFTQNCDWRLLDWNHLLLTVYKSFGDFLFAELSAMALAWATQQGEKVGKSKRLRLIVKKD